MNFFLTRRAPLRVDTALRQLLLDYRLDRATSTELNDWLLQVGEPPQGAIHERILRIREHASYLDLPCEDFPAVVLGDLERYTLDELAALCRLLGIVAVGDRDASSRHILQTVLQREGWIPARDSFDIEQVREREQWRLVPLALSPAPQRDRSGHPE